jgi:glucosamine kinase
VAYYLGIDGGGSKTICAVGDEMSLLATASSGPSNINRVGEARARASLHQSIRQACAAAGIAPSQVERTCVGAAGAARAEMAAVVRRIVADAIHTQILVIGDMQIALEAAFGEGPGVIVIAGTGSIAYGRDQQGNTARAGGWGFAVSDEGSAHWIGRTALSATLRSRDQSGGTESPLLAEFIKAWQLRSAEDLMRAANTPPANTGNTIPAPDFGAFFPPVLAASETGDALAQRILSAAASELAQLADIVITRLFLQNEQGAVPVAMVGGVFRYSSLVRELFYNEICKSHARVLLRAEIVEPVLGALQMARKAAGKIAASR